MLTAFHLAGVPKGRPCGCGAMAQLVARLHGMQKVRGSNPLSSTDFRICVLSIVTNLVTNGPIPVFALVLKFRPGGKRLHRAAWPGGSIARRYQLAPA